MSSIQPHAQSMQSASAMLSGRTMQNGSAMQSDSALHKATGLKDLAPLGEGGITLEKALELRDTFSSKFGSMLYGQMIKAMRSTVGEAAYFHGGQAEEIFRGQLDQLMSESMANANGERLVKPMFERKFPQHAAVIENHTNQQSAKEGIQLDDLTQLMRR